MSDLALYSGISEFIERQSLIATWVGKRAGNQYDISTLPKDMKNKNIMNRFERIFSYFKLYDISIFSGVFVLLLLGINDKDFSIGVCASCSFSDALCGALDEFQQSYESILLFHNSSQSRKQDRYKTSFLKQSPSELKAKYLFLEQMRPLKVSKELSNDSNENKLFKLKKALRTIPLDYYAVAVVPSMRQINIRIVKIFSPDAFPHMNTEIINPRNYKITNFIGMNSFPNENQPLPFP